MCFSPTVSFTAGILLIAAGSYCIKKSAQIKNNKYRLFSAFPLLFGIQQIIEGMLWVKIGDTENTRLPLLGFLFFSQFLWLIWTPLAVLMTEDQKYKRLICKICLISGLLLGITFYIPAIFSDHLYQAFIEQKSICYRYVLAIDYPILQTLLIPYTIIILTPLLISSSRYIRTFGIMIIVSMLITLAFYQYALTSVWCFFAAIASLYIVYFLHKISSAKI